MGHFPGRSPFLCVKLLFLVGALSSCGAETGNETGEGSAIVRDSAGVTIVETSGTVARSPINWTVAEAPDLQIGSATSSDADQFFLLEKNVVGLSDGRILVQGTADGELRFFDEGGRFLHSTGGLGDGPGEFSLPFFVPYLTNDSVLVYDLRSRRLTLFSDDGLGFRAFIPQDRVSEFVVGRIWGASARGVLSSGSPPPASLGMERERPNVRWADLESDEVVVVGSYEDPPEYEHVDQQTARRSRYNVPFHTAIAAALTSDGIVVKWGNAPEIRTYDFAGRLARILRVSEPLRPVTADDVEMAIAAIFSSSVGRSESEVRNAVNAMDLPDHVPAFDDVIHVDPQGWLWVGLYQPSRAPGGRDWMLFDPDGAARGTIELPVELDLTYVGLDYILGVWRDELGVEYIQRYQLNRGN